MKAKPLSAWLAGSLIYAAAIFALLVYCDRPFDAWTIQCNSLREFRYVDGENYAHEGYHSSAEASQAMNMERNSTDWRKCK